MIETHSVLVVGEATEGGNIYSKKVASLIRKQIKANTGRLMLTANNITKLEDLEDKSRAMGYAVGAKISKKNQHNREELYVDFELTDVGYNVYQQLPPDKIRIILIGMDDTPESGEVTENYKILAFKITS